MTCSCCSSQLEVWMLMCSLCRSTGTNLREILSMI